MSIDEYSKQLLPESKSTQIGNPAWTFVKCCVLAMLQLISFKALSYFRHLYYFHEIMFFKALSAFKALIYYMFIEWQTNKNFQSAFSFQSASAFKALQLSKRFCSCISAFLFLHKRFYLIVQCESALVYFF